METINAIAKVRFSSARPQRVQLHRSDSLQVELVCMEPGQQLRAPKGEWSYYMITGKGAVTGGGAEQALPTGQMAVSHAGEACTITNAGEQRLVVLAVGRPA
jgi:quercetin dioxygenase-like cupin family protein